jgi:hypothetical protein
LRLSNADLGIIAFFSEWQIKMALDCQIFVMDGTFSVAPIGFYQLFSVHGLYSKERNEEGEWVTLGWCLMEKRSGKK